MDAAGTRESHGKLMPVSPQAEFEFHLVFSNKTETDSFCLEIWGRLTARGVQVWQQKKNIPKDSDNWFNEWYPSATKSIKIVCFLTVAYLKSIYCMKEFGIALGLGKLLVVVCEPVRDIAAVDPTQYPHASNALAYLMGGGQVIFHDRDDVVAEIMKFLPHELAAAPEPEPEQARLGAPPNYRAPTPSVGAAAGLYESAGTVAALLAEVRLSTYAAAFSSEGYEFVMDVLDADQKDLEELMTTLGMKKPERKRFERALKLSRDAADGSAQTVDSAGATGAATPAEASRNLDAQRAQLEGQVEALRREQSAMKKQAARLQEEAARQAKARVAAEEEEASVALARQLQEQEQTSARKGREGREKTAGSPRLAAGLSVGNRVVSTISFSDSTGSVAPGDVGTVRGPCNNASFPEPEKGVNVDFPRIKNLNVVAASQLVKADSPLAAMYRPGSRLSGGLSVGDRVVSTTRYSGSTGSVAPGDVGTVRGPCSNPLLTKPEKKVEVEFPGIKSLNMFAESTLVKADSPLAAMYRAGSRLPGGLSVGDRVVSTVSYSGSTGSVAAGDVGTVRGPCSNPSVDEPEKLVNVEFPRIKGINMYPTTIRRA